MAGARARPAHPGERGEPGVPAASRSSGVPELGGARLEVWCSSVARSPPAMAVFAAVSSALPALYRLPARSPFSAARSSLAAASSASRPFASSSVFGHRLLAIALGFALGDRASSPAVRGMETVTASAASVTSGSSIYDFVVKVLRRLVPAVWPCFFFSSSLYCSLLWPGSFFSPLFFFFSLRLRPA